MKIEISILAILTILLVGAVGYLFVLNDEKSSKCFQETDLTEQRRCFEQEALAKNDPEICKNIVENQALCYIYLARENKDAQFCEEIEDKMSKYSCYLNVALVTRDPVVCERFITDETIETKEPLLFKDPDAYYQWSNCQEIMKAPPSYWATQPSA